jgi:AraC family transcriptional regulator of adaptative response/methylated-DNA-[protein]-cysteine methyltransferase
MALHDTARRLSMLDEDQCWDAVLRHDRSQDGRFFTGVLTTGIYCRPSCPARRPLRRNVRFYETSAAAEAAGLRPCLRCRPLETAEGVERASRERFEQLCGQIRRRSESGEPWTLEALARDAGVSPSHLQRTFRAAVGVTPRQYGEACRLEALKRQLRAGEPVTRAIYDAGFGSSSRVYERVDSRLGMTPTEYRAGGLGLAISYAAIDSPLGLLMVGATDRGLCFVQFGDSPEALAGELRREYPKAELEAVEEPYSDSFAEWIEALRRHLAGDLSRLDLPLAVRASAFQLKVWAYLQSIPYGQVRSYGEVAAALGRPTAARAVARACASNRTALAIPCHRVIRGTGELGGYRWGLERKRRLLDRERAAAPAAR